MANETIRDIFICKGIHDKLNKIAGTIKIYTILNY